MTIRLVGLATVCLVMAVLQINTSIVAQIRPEIDGTYVFVSETTTRAAGNSKKTVRQYPEWRGIYIFQTGAYSISLASLSRKDVWIPSFPKDYVELGYESEAGTFAILGTRLTLRADVVLYPSRYHSSTDFDFTIEGDKLTLTGKVPTHSTRILSGDIVTVLKKVSSDKLDEL